MGPSLGTKSLRALTSPVIVRRGNRLTGASSDGAVGLGQTATPPDSTASWHTLQVLRKELLSLPYQRLARIALDLSPQVNKGLWDFLRFSNPGYVLKVSGARVERTIDDFIKRLDVHYGSFKGHLDSMWTGIFISGGVFLELVLDTGGMMAADIAVNDPVTARFRRESDVVRGARWRLGQETLNGWVYLDDNPLVKYLGFDRLSDNPYGRPVLGPAVHASLTLLMLIDLFQKVLANQGLSKLDYELQADELLNLIDRNPDIAGNDEATAQFIGDQIESVKSVVSSLEPDQDYVHLSTVKVNYASPGVVGGSGQGFGSLQILIDKLQRDVVNGVKAVTSLHNFLDSTTETHIRSQLEYYVSGLQSLQDDVSDLLTQFLMMVLRVQGVGGSVEFLFKKQRTADRKASAEIRKMEIEMILSQIEAGLISVEEGRAEKMALSDELQVR